MAYNAISTLLGALRATHGDAVVRDQVSGYYIAQYGRDAAGAIDDQIEPEDWKPWQVLSLAAAAALLKEIAPDRAPPASAAPTAVRAPTVGTAPAATPDRTAARRSRSSVDPPLTPAVTVSPGAKRRAVPAHIVSEPHSLFRAEPPAPEEGLELRLDVPR